MLLRPPGTGSRACAAAYIPTHTFGVTSPRVSPSPGPKTRIGTLALALALSGTGSLAPRSSPAHLPRRSFEHSFGLSPSALAPALAPALALGGGARRWASAAPGVGSGAGLGSGGSGSATGLRLRSGSGSESESGSSRLFSTGPVPGPVGSSRPAPPPASPSSTAGSTPGAPPSPKANSPSNSPYKSGSQTRTGTGSWTRRFGIVLVLGATGWAADEYLNARTVQRNLLTAYTGAAIALDYKFNFDRNSLESINSLHERSAERLLNVCEKNQGLYIKLGQAIGVQAAILPKPYHKLSKLFDNAERLPWPVVEKILTRELGAPTEEFFVSIDKVPIAAASVAQVHRARLRLPSGEEVDVAVKVQRPDIRRYAKWDLWAFRTMLKLYERIFELPLSFAGQYISDQIEQETFFDAEMRNSQRARKAVQEDPEKLVRNTCYVPFVYEHVCTPRVLIMEWIEGAVRMTDRERIEGMGLSVKEVVRSVSEAFASQIFQHGFVQADGHPSNVLVRQHPNGKRGAHQVVLIDHGLYVELSPAFRRQYAQLWKAIFTLDMPMLESITRSWGIGEGSSELFASATLMRPWKKPTKGKQTAGEHKHKSDLELQREMKDRIKNFLVNVELLPKELVFVSRSMRIIQANNQVLGSPVNRLNILARHAAAALIGGNTPTFIRTLRPTSPDAPAFNARLAEWLRDRVAYLRFRTTLFVLDIAFVGSSWAHWLSFLVRAPAKALGLVKSADSDRGGGFEDDLEHSMRQMARDEFGVELDESAFAG